MTEERALTWSRKWHIVKESRPESKVAVAQCGAYLYKNDDPKLPNHLRAIIDGKNKSTGVCKLCTRSAGVKTVTVELPEPTWSQPATDDENGHVEWPYPHGSVAVSDDGTIMWGQWHITDPQKLIDAGSALIAAAEHAKWVTR